ncbi:MAG: acetolactate synthase small subunit [Kiritimatiellia bacterium]
MKHVITMLVENKPGVLARIVSIISGRGYNIESLNVAPTHDATLSRMTIKVPGDDRVLDQVTKQLNKLLDVVKVTDLTRKRHLNRELVLVEVAASSKNRPQIVELAGLFEAKVVAVKQKSVSIQIAGEQDKIEDFINLLKPYRILEISRTGVIALAQGREEG